MTDSDGLYGYTDLDGYFSKEIPIHGVLGDSHGALFGQGCLTPGMIKATFGTGSSVMMNIGEKPIFSDAGIVTSLAWSMGGKVNYVLEGNINYTGSVIKWLVDDVKLLGASRESGEFAAKANPEDTTYLVPAFSGLGAPYWDSEAKAAIVGMTRSTGKAEIVKAAEECIAYQITDLVLLMQQESGLPITEIRVDGGPTRICFRSRLQFRKTKNFRASAQLMLPVLLWGCGISLFMKKKNAPAICRRWTNLPVKSAMTAGKRLSQAF